MVFGSMLASGAGRGDEHNKEAEEVKEKKKLHLC
jgi:hypothetical protein